MRGEIERVYMGVCVCVYVRSQTTFVIVYFSENMSPNRVTHTTELRRKKTFHTIQFDWYFPPLRQKSTCLLGALFWNLSFSFSLVLILLLSHAFPIIQHSDIQSNFKWQPIQSRCRVRENKNGTEKIRLHRTKIKTATTTTTNRTMLF